MISEMVDIHLQAIKDSLAGEDDCILGALTLLRRAKLNGGRVLVLGNGGSMAIAQHFAQDLLKACRVRAWTINCPSVLTAHANDDGFERSFFNPAMTLISEGDPIFIFSCSGKSRNYSDFFSDGISCPIVSVVGTDGGFLKEKSNVSIHVKSHDYQVCETAFSVVCDILIKKLLEG